MPLTEKEVLDRLDPKHLKEVADVSTESLKKEAEQATGITEKQKDPEEDPRSQREYPFLFKWVDNNGKIWEGQFTNRILSIRDRQAIGVTRARLAMGLPAESIDEYTAEINLMVAHMMFSLIESPDWAKDLRNLDNVQLLQEIYSEVLAHEATFHGRNKITEFGQEESS